MQESIDSFDDFWPHYVHAHRHPINRALHYAGTTAVLAPVVGYAPAWIGHFVFEKNKPATFQHPLWSLRGDFKMYLLALQGKMGAEVDRFCGGELPLDHGHADHLAHAAEAGAQNGSATATA
jgi:hypothetical protein